jgi:hypothetical protein
MLAEGFPLVTSETPILRFGRNPRWRHHDPENSDRTQMPADLFRIADWIGPPDPSTSAKYTLFTPNRSFFAFYLSCYIKSMSILTTKMSDLIEALLFWNV